jgi:plasmid stability protein
MPSLSIKDVPEQIVQQLRERAARHHRSLQGELMALISAAVAGERDPAANPGAPRDPVAGTPGRPAAGGKTIEQIAREHRARFPNPLAAGPAAVDIVRADRDSR